MAQDGRDTSPMRALSRSLNLPQAISLNVANMVGVGPFITIGLMLGAMQGPQVVVSWLVAGLLVLCDGLVWSELGAALPGSG
jgi:amino acid transporter